MTEGLSARRVPQGPPQIVVAGHICLDVIPQLDGALDVHRVKG